MKNIITSLLFCFPLLVFSQWPHNVTLGANSLSSNSPSYNVAIGEYAGNSIDSGSSIGNVAVGYASMDAGSSPSYSTAIGRIALKSNTSSRNIGIGYAAGDVITSGTNNTILGTEADPSASGATNQTVIGYGATGQANNSVVLGNASVTAIYMSQDSGAAIYAGDATFGGDVTISSDSRLKSNIVSLGSTISKLLLIDGKSYSMNSDGKQKIGVLAQEVQDVFPELVGEDTKGMLTVNYQGLVPVLINALKEQDEKINRLEMLVENLIKNQWKT